MANKKLTNSEMWDKEIEKLLKTISELESKTNKTQSYKPPTKPKRVSKNALKKLKTFRKNLTKQSKTNVANVKHNTSSNVGNNSPNGGTKRPTKAQKEWAKQEKNLKRRIKRLADKGYDVSGITIPEKPTIITKKRLQELTELTRKKLLEQVTHKLPTGEIISGTEYDKIQRIESAKRGQITRQINKLKKENPEAEVIDIGEKIYIATPNDIEQVEIAQTKPQKDEIEAGQEVYETDETYITENGIEIDKETGEILGELDAPDMATMVLDNFYDMLGDGDWLRTKNAFQITTQNDIIRTIIEELVDKYGERYVAQKLQEAEQNGVKLNYEVLYNMEGNTFINDFLEYFNIPEEQRRIYSNYISDITTTTDLK